MNTFEDFSRYLPVDHSHKVWGLHVMDTGFTRVKPGANYPPSNHPAHYGFHSSKRRRLQEYQIIYITEGAGVFESSSAGSINVEAGHVILLFPDEWHSYAPNKETGWTEHWIGFSGEFSDRLMVHYFNKKYPVLSVGYSAELIRIIEQIYDSSKLKSQSVMSGYTLAVISYISDFIKKTNNQGSIERTIEKAKGHILRNYGEEIDLEELSRMLGLGYSNFRTHFKQKTGFSPRQYQLFIRLNIAKELLAKTDYKINEITTDLGFKSTYYFSRIFKQKEGISPSDHRKKYS